MRQSGAGTHIPGVRRTPCENEHDVTFSWSCDQEKITQNRER